MIYIIQFNKVILHNFGSYGHAEISLHHRGFCLVEGKNNYKKDNAISNGAGKSFLWSAICFAITGETINGLHSNLKNINAPIDDPECFVSLDFSINKNLYFITRYITPRTDLKIIQNGADISGKGLRESEKKLKELIPDLNKDLIASTIIIGQGMPNKFSSFTPSGRKELLEKLTKSDFMIEDLKTRVNARLLFLSTKIRENEDSLLVNNTQLQALHTSVDQKQKTLDIKTRLNFDNTLIALNTQISKLQFDLAELDLQIKALEASIEADTKALLTATNDKSTTLNEEYTAYSTAITKLNKDYAEINVKKNSLQQEIANLKAIKDVCPTCGQKLVGITKPDTTVPEAQYAELSIDLRQLANKIDTCNTTHKQYLAEIGNAFDNEIALLNQRLADNKSLIEQLKAKKNRATDQVTKNQEEIVKLNFEKANLDATIKTLNEDIQNNTRSITQITNFINLTAAATADLKDRLAIVKKMETLLKRDFRGYLLENIINYIDKKAKEYCEIVFGTKELNVYLAGNSLDISYCNKMFDNLSGGEKQRIDLILQFAIRNMLITYLNINSNILVLDEITDFLDKQSCAAVMKLIEAELNTVESVFIISHHVEELDLPIDSEIHVIKNKNGISEVI